MIKKILFSATFLLVNTVFLPAQDSHPNILLIIADDLGIDVLNGYQQNERMPNTPHLDALRTSGLTFTNTWATPQCTPSRAALMSGKYGIKTGVMRPPGNLDLEHESLFKRIAAATDGLYRGALIGKWHISSPADFDHPAQHGVDHYEGLFTAQVDDYYNWEKVTNGVASTSDEYVTTNLTNAAINWIGEQDSPWLLWLAHAAPHGPFHVPPDSLYTQTNTRDNLGKYLAMVEAMDHEIGRLLNSMDEATRSNTVVIFVGDNGTPAGVIQNFPSNHAKSTLYEGGLRVPLLVSGKGVSRINEEEHQINHIADLHATILDLTGNQLNGGINNSKSLKPLLSCASNLNRDFVYTDYEDGNILGWAIRNQDYKLIADENGRQEFYNITSDLQEANNLIGNLSAEEVQLLADMEAEVVNIRTGWSCADGIQNGTETAIDDCADECTGDNSTNFENIGCCEVPQDPSVYYEYIVGNQRRIYTNNFPDHDYCYNSVNQMPEQVHHDFGVPLVPTLADEITSVVRANGRPAGYFGVAKNGVIFAPAPATPFIFENQNTGEFNWDWVFEPTNNQGSGPDLVGLDCASAHTGPQGYHYHGNMFSYVDNVVAGISSTADIPLEPLHIGWAADGFPILYRFGPDPDGNIRELQPSYQLRAGLRPGDGITAPCGAFNGKYTRDYEYLCGRGDLDECNGIQSEVTLETADGQATFSYFYVITSTFPQVPRCLMGNVSSDFVNGSNAPLTGVDNDNDGFLSDYDCDDNNPAINPLAEEIEGNDVDENCDDRLTSVRELVNQAVVVSPNPSNGAFSVKLPDFERIVLSVFGADGRLIQQQSGSGTINVKGLSSGTYFLRVTFSNGSVAYKKQIVW
ncbi:MAG: sulfatase-like hydrolase/transferase [Bacteroidota bacterium]